MKLLTIGEVAKITNISIKTIRYYDEIGIITPEVRDENTGYRYYSDTQIVYLQILKTFKSLGFSLEDIKSIIYNDKTSDSEHIITLKNKLKIKLYDIQKETHKLIFQSEAISKAYESLDRGLNMLSFSNDKKSHQSISGTSEYNIHMFPELWTLSIRKNSSLNVEQLFIDRCLELQKLLDNYHLFKSGGYVCILHDGFQSQFFDTYGDLELCIPIVKPEGFTCPELKLVGGYLVASTKYVGHYKNSYEKYLSLVDWIFDAGYKIVGPPIEYYLLDPFLSVGSDSYTTKLYFPISE